jgi:SWI/SNF-related matrix-associated actin-dependent regulator 1 of chromatin subfamily A
MITDPKIYPSLQEQITPKYTGMEMKKVFGLFDHQVEGIKFLIDKKRVILADPMGIGKTLQAIVANGEGSGDGALIVCPASLKINWKREILHAYPEAFVQIVSTGEEALTQVTGIHQSERGLYMNSKRPWFIINYDILEKMLPWIEGVVGTGIVGTLILDEAHYIKGKSIRATCIVGGKVKRKDGTVAKFEGIAPKMKQVYALTGTPLMNRPIEMFNLLRAIGHPLGRVRTHFARRYCGAYLKTIIRRYGPPIRFLDESGATNLDELREVLKTAMIRRKKKDVLDLPPKIVSVMEHVMDSEWSTRYETAWDNYLAFVEANPIPERSIDNIIMARHLVEIQKLKQVCSQAKVSRIVSDIRNAAEQDEKVIVFSQYTETIKQIAAGLGKGEKGRDPIGCVTLTGADDMNERQLAVDRFQRDPNVRVFIANIKAGGVGITLTEASIVMFADMDWSPEIHNQAEDRAHRIGQAGTVNVYYYVVPDTIEEDVIDILNYKRDVMDRVLEGKDISSESAQRVFLERISKKITNRAN